VQPPTPPSFLPRGRRMRQGAASGTRACYTRRTASTKTMTRDLLGWCNSPVALAVVPNLCAPGLRQSWLGRGAAAPRRQTCPCLLRHLYISIRLEPSQGRKCGEGAHKIIGACAVHSPVPVRQTHSSQWHQGIGVTYQARPQKDD